MVIFRWLMMRASVRGNRSKQFTQQGTIVVAPSPAPTESVSPCARVHVGFCLAKRERAQGGNGGTQTPSSVADALVVTLVF